MLFDAVNEPPLAPILEVAIGLEEEHGFPNERVGEPYSHKLVHELPFRYKSTDSDTTSDLLLHAMDLGPLLVCEDGNVHEATPDSIHR